MKRLILLLSAVFCLSAGALFALDLPAGKVLFVSAETGSARGDGTQQKPFKDLQKALDKAEDGTTICVAEGNYLGRLNQGYLVINKYVTVQGGYKRDFSERDFTRYLTTVQPSAEQAGTSGGHPVVELAMVGKADGCAVIDGLMLNKGQMNNYCKADPGRADSGTPAGCETGRLLPPGAGAVGGTTGGATIAQKLMGGTCEGNIIIRNCAFVNGNNYGLQLGCKAGKVEVCDCVFVANCMAACELNGLNADPARCTADFHHNTVLFSWSREKTLEDMGYGFRFMPGLNADVHHNIFGCSVMAALDRGRVRTPAEEAKRTTSAYNNAFFMNHADLALPSGGGKWLFVPAAQFEEVEQLEQYEGNTELSAADGKALQAVVNEPYLKGFAALRLSTEQQYAPGSAANELRRLLGLQQQGKETVRVSMFANRYPFAAVPALFGAVQHYGARR